MTESRTPRFDGMCRICTTTPKRYTNGLCRTCDATYRRELRARRQAITPYVPVHKRWTPRDNAILVANWGKVHPTELMKALDRTYDSLRVQASKLGLRSGRRGGNKHKFDNEFGCTCAHTVGRCWTADGVAYLTLHYQTSSIEAIAERLARTPNAVRIKANRLGILRVDPYADEEAAA